MKTWLENLSGETTKCRYPKEYRGEVKFVGRGQWSGYQGNTGKFNEVENNHGTSSLKRMPCTPLVFTEFVLEVESFEMKKFHCTKYA